MLIKRADTWALAAIILVVTAGGHYFSGSIIEFLARANIGYVGFEELIHAAIKSHSYRDASALYYDEEFSKQQYGLTSGRSRFGDWVLWWSEVQPEPINSIHVLDRYFNDLGRVKAWDMPDVPPRDSDLNGLQELVWIASPYFDTIDQSSLVVWVELGKDYNVVKWVGVLNETMLKKLQARPYIVWQKEPGKERLNIAICAQRVMPGVGWAEPEVYARVNTVEEGGKLYATKSWEGMEIIVKDSGEKGETRFPQSEAYDEELRRVGW